MFFVIITNSKANQANHCNNRPTICLTAGQIYGSLGNQKNHQKNPLQPVKFVAA